MPRGPLARRRLPTELGIDLLKRHVVNLLLKAAVATTRFLEERLPGTNSLRGDHWLSVP
jgi:hypothetical protein